jgi:LPXTG-site transpeptidase (sortase) family protein
MYRRRRSPFANISSLILLGILAGIIFVLYDNFTHPSTPAPQPSFTATPEPTATPTIPTATTSAGIVQQASLYIPGAAVSAPIIPVYLKGGSWDVTQLGDNIGHLEGTGWLDKPGNIVLSGHVERRNGRPGIFASLSDLSRGDEIILLTQGIERRYRVSDLRTVEPTDLTPLYPTTSDVLTLITCDEYDFLQNTYQKRTVVVAERLS